MSIVTGLHMTNVAGQDTYISRDEQSTIRACEALRVVAWTYEADMHCLACAVARFGADVTADETTDREGNPLAAVLAWDPIGDGGDVCGDCLGIIRS